MKSIIWLCVLLACLVPKGIVCSSKLNLPRVLLPLFRHSAANYTLEISDNGCYEWQLSRLDVIQIIPIDVSPSGCSSKALISTISRELARNTVIVIAEDIHSGQTLRCDVIVDIIDSLYIVTKTRELYMEEAPEIFEVRAYDSQENEFTTLDNIEFQWNIGISSSGNGREQTVLRFMSFKDSPYETPSTVLSLDQKGQKGHMVLLEGLKTGSAKVSVNLPHTEYRHVLPAEVNLMVVANLLIDPPDAYVLKGDTVKFRLLQLRHGRIIELSISSSQYIFTMENQTIAETIDSRGSILALENGRTKLILQYSNDASIRLPHAYITVTNPEYITLSLLPDRNWAVEINKYYNLIIHVYDIGNRKFHLGEFVQIELKISEQYFQIESSCKNGTYYYGKTLKTGSVPIYAELQSIGNVVYDSLLFVREEMNIYSHIDIQPKQYVLPWEENLKYNLIYKATGGDGSYSWISNDNNIATVTQNGVVQTLGYGHVNITVSMIKNKNNKDTSLIILTKPTRLEIKNKYNLESEINKPIYLYVALYFKQDKKEIAFTNCQQLSFQIIIENENFMHNDTFKQDKNIEESCANIPILSNHIGHTRVVVRYEIDNGVIEDSVIINTYNPLTIIQPDSGETVLALGTSRHLVFTGGPNYLNNKKITKKLDYNNTIVDIYEVQSKELYIYNVLCKHIGETNIKISIGSCITHCNDNKNIESISNVKVYCSEPKYIIFNLKNNENCPINNNLNEISILNYKEYNLNVIIKNKDGKVFDNATSLNIEWNINNNYAQAKYTGIVLLNYTSINNYNIPLNHYQIIIPKKKLGKLIELNIKIMNYRNIIVKNIIHYNILNFEQINNQLLINFIFDLNIENRNVILFNHPKNYKKLEINSGSGYYNLNISNNKLINYKLELNNLIIYPLEYGFVNIIIEDRCLESKPIELNINIKQIHSIKINTNQNKIQINNESLIQIQFYDNEENLLPINQIEYLDLKYKLNEINILELKEKSIDLNKNIIHYEMKGISIGTTNVLFTITIGNTNILSNSITVFVYEPLVLSPRHVVLPLHSKIYINKQGGPYLDCTYEFISDNDNVKILDSGFILGNKLGFSKITGMAIGSSSNKKLIYSQDIIHVEVIQIKNIKINIPLLKIIKGSVVPIYITGTPNDITPLLLNTITPKLIYKWKISNEQVANFTENQFYIQEEQNYYRRLYARKQGKCTINVKVYSINNQIYSDTIQIEVIDNLYLLDEEHEPDIPSTTRKLQQHTRNIFSENYYKPILLSLNTNYQIKTNKKYNEITFKIIKIIGEGIDKALTTTTSNVASEDIITVNNEGLIQTYNQSGKSLIQIEILRNDHIKIIKEILIYVKPVHYIMININSQLHKNQDNENPLLGLPTGMNLLLKINYYDELGAKFTSVQSQIHLVTNRNDLIEFKLEKNNSIYTKLIQPGESVLKIQDDISMNKPQDFIQFNVQQFISPQKSHLVTGDVVCFSMPKICNQGSWSSSHSDVFTIDSDLGIGRARNKPGSTNVNYYLPDCDISSNTNIKVLPIHAIHFIPNKNKTISNVPSETYKAELVLFNNYEATTSKSNNLIAAEGSKCRNIDHYNILHYPFSCSAKFVQVATSLLLFEDIYDLQPGFSLKTGLYYCELIPKSSSYNGTLHKAEIILKASSIHGTITSQPISFIFYPAPQLYPEKLAFQTFKPTTLVVKALPDVLGQITVTPSHDNYVRIEVGNTATPTAQQYKVYLLEKSRTEPRRDLYVQVNSPLTHQTIQVSIDLGVAVASNTEACILTEPWFDFSSSKTTNSISSFAQNLKVWITLAIIMFVIIVIILVLEYFKYVSHQGGSNQTKLEPNEELSPKIMKFSSLSSNPMHRISPVSTSRRPFDELSPVYGSPKSPTAPRRRVVNLSQLSNNSSLNGSWS